MKRIFTLSLSFVALCLISCGGSGSQNKAADAAKADGKESVAKEAAQVEEVAEAEVAEPVEKAAAAENFENFIKKFASDYNFQLTRITFPVGMSVSIAEDGSEEKTPYTKQMWNNMRFGKFMEEFSERSQTEEGGHKYVWESDGGACGGFATFTLVAGQWRMTDYSSYCF